MLINQLTGCTSDWRSLIPCENSKLANGGEDIVCWLIPYREAAICLITITIRPRTRSPDPLSRLSLKGP